VLSSRVALGVGTFSLVAVTSISTAVLVNDGAQRLVEPLAAAPRPTAPTFKSPPLVVPETPGTVVANPVVQRPSAPRVRVVVTAPRQVAGPPAAQREVEPKPAGQPVNQPAEEPIEKPRAALPGRDPLVVEPVKPGKGKHLGVLKAAARDTGRGQEPARRKGPSKG